MPCHLNISQDKLSYVAIANESPVSMSQTLQGHFSHCRTPQPTVHSADRHFGTQSSGAAKGFAGAIVGKEEPQRAASCCRRLPSPDVALDFTCDLLARNCHADTPAQTWDRRGNYHVLGRAQAGGAGRAVLMATEQPSRNQGLFQIHPDSQMPGSPGEQCMTLLNQSLMQPFYRRKD